jgi:hypothetical protein
MSVQRNFGINQLGEKDRKPFGDQPGEESRQALGRAVFHEASQGEMAVFMGDQKGKVLKIPKPFQSQGDHRRFAYLHGASVGAEKSDKKINRGLGLQREDRLAFIQRLFGQNGRVLPLNERVKVPVIRFFDLPDPGGDLIHAEMVKIPPIGHKKFFMGVKV